MNNEEKQLLYEDLVFEDLTPMMQQYVSEKKKYQDAFLFFRLGDFYELFFDDAVLAAKILGIALTKRDCGQEQRAPMCGVPHHASESYISRLVEAGHKVAICEQVENPEEAKGLVRREVVRVISPGTITNPDNLDALNYHHIAAIFKMDCYYGIAYADISASKFSASEIITGNSHAKLLNELERIKPLEIVANQQFAESSAGKDYLKDRNINLSLLDDKAFSQEKRAHYGLSLEQDDFLWASATAGLLTYLEENAFVLPKELPAIQPYRMEEFMILDQTARRHLEITETLRTRERRGSLLWAIDNCETSMGSRLLHSFISQPLMDLKEIEWRQNCIKAFQSSFILRSNLRKELRTIYDLERLTGRLALLSANPRDLAAIANIQARIPMLQGYLYEFNNPALSDLARQLDPLEEITSELLASLNDELPVKITEGDIFRDGAYPELDALRLASRNGNEWLLEFERQEKEKTGIKSLKLKYNRVFGYSIEISKSYLDQVPEHYQRRQTLVNAERFYTDELKEMEERILGAEQKMLILEQELFVNLRAKLATYVSILRNNAKLLALIDLFASQADLAEKRNYTCPRMVATPILEIEQGRHPVVERILPQGEFVANDVYLDTADYRLMILTGPNMAGKSTYMRQVALIVIMAQAGLFVPASLAVIGLCDRIFTRIGASDDLATGKSTFMIEMTEVSQIIREASSRSLLILDEIGRGTSTWDGLSIAWAVIEHVANANYIGCRTMFATHYHELTELAGSVEGVFNAHVDIVLENNELRFVHLVKEGGANHSYGIEVAKLADVPDSLIIRSREILHMLEEENQGKRLKIKNSSRPMEGQIDLFSAARQWQFGDEIIKRIAELDLNMLRPLDALAELADLQDKVKKGETIV